MHKRWCRLIAQYLTIHSAKARVNLSPPPPPPQAIPYHGEFSHNLSDLCIWHRWHLLDTPVKSWDPASIFWNVLGKEQLVGWAVLQKKPKKKPMYLKFISWIDNTHRNWQPKQCPFQYRTGTVYPPCPVYVQKLSSCPWKSGQSQIGMNQQCVTCGCRKQTRGSWWCWPRISVADWKYEKKDPTYNIGWCSPPAREKNDNRNRQNIPVAFPCVDNIWINDVVPSCCRVQKVKEILDGRWQGAVHFQQGQE